MTEEMLSVPTPDGEMGAYVRRPDGDGPFPVIVYFHHGPGLDEGSKESMQLLADAGYYVVSPDRYHREGHGSRSTPRSCVRARRRATSSARRCSASSWGRPTTWSRAT